MSSGCNNFYARQLCFARLSYGLGICPPVWPSVTPLNSIKTVQAKITKSLLWATPRTLVFRVKILCLWVRGFPSNEGVRERCPLEKRCYAALGSPSVKTVADDTDKLLITTSTGHELFSFINIGDLERSWTHTRRFLTNLSHFFGCSAHFKSELRRTGDRPRQPAFEIFCNKYRF